MTELSQHDVDEAAREAGISPAELRSALAEQAAARTAGGALVRRPSEAGLLPASPRGDSIANAESTLPLPPEQAVRAIKQHIESQIGSKGHMMGSKEADIYDERHGLIYRVQAESDGGGGSLVRIDIDPTPLRSRRTLRIIGLVASVGFLGLVGLVVPGLVGWAILAAAGSLGVFGSAGLAVGSSQAARNGRYVASTALVEAEHGSPIGGMPALPP